MTQPSNLTELYDALTHHDWFYAYSDDHRVFTAGCTSSTQLFTAARSIPGGEELFSAFQNAVWANKPLPARPMPIAEAA